MSDFLFLGEVADELGVKPYVLSTLFNQRELDRERCPLKGQRRIIPRDYVAVIREKLIAKGKLPAPAKLPPKPRRKMATARA